MTHGTTEDIGEDIGEDIMLDTGDGTTLGTIIIITTDGITLTINVLSEDRHI